MLVKCIYYLKLFLITAFAILITASVDIIFDNPILFLSVMLFLSISIRFLWHSALKDEKKMKKHTKIYKVSTKTHTNNAGRAA